MLQPIFLPLSFIFQLLLCAQNGPDERSIPGNTIAVQADMPFRGLTAFGTAFLSKFECSQMPHPVSCQNMAQAKSFFLRFSHMPKWHLELSIFTVGLLNLGCYFMNILCAVTPKIKGSLSTLMLEA